jgi:hypothetical protein
VIWFGRTIHDPSCESSVSAAWGTFLKTLNGPNNYCNALPGNLGAMTGQSQQVYELNIYPFGPPNIDSGEDFHPSLRRDDGHVFITTLCAGRTFYFAGGSIDDPFYAAHNQHLGSYIPDYEATALGCVEQVRMCFNDTKKSFCSEMVQSTKATMDMIVWGADEKVLVGGIGLLGSDLLFIFNAFFMGLASVGHYAK